jgi:dihydroxyacetone kinase DhaKLM complex PTS-EIIA-like component DhaM
MVALVLVGHSSELLGGLRAMLAQVAPSLHVRVAGGTDAGALGTSAPLILHAVRSALAEAPDGAIVLLDLGSAALALEMALDDLEPADRARIRVSRGALVEGAVRAAVEAAGGGSLATVLAASEMPPGRDKLPDDWPADGAAPLMVPGDLARRRAP